MRRVLSMWQPWATLCVAPHLFTGTPAKRHETRAFPPRCALPVDVVIHATLKWDRSNVWTAAERTFRDALRQCGFLSGPATRLGILADPNLRPLPLGMIIGVATIAGVHPTQSLLDERLGARSISSIDHVLGDWSPGRFAWRFENTALLPEPIPFKGRQDVLYQLDPIIEGQVDEQLAGATI